MNKDAEAEVKRWAEIAADQQVRQVLAEARQSGADIILQLEGMILASRKVIELAEKAKARIEAEQNRDGRLH